MINNDLNVFRATIASKDTTGASPVLLFNESVPIVSRAYCDPIIEYVRFYHKDHDVFYCLKDVCKCLDIYNVNDIIDKIDQRSLTSIPSINTEGKQSTSLFVDKHGLCDAILSTQPDEKTRDFKRVIFLDVIPNFHKGIDSSASTITTEMRRHKFLFYDIFSPNIETYIRASV